MQCCLKVPAITTYIPKHNNIFKALNSGFDAPENFDVWVNSTETTFLICNFDACLMTTNIDIL